MNSEAIKSQINEMGGDSVISMPGYFQARFSDKWKADDIAARSFDGKADVSECPSGEGFFVVYSQ